MNLKYLLVPLMAFALGILSPVTLAKGHGKPYGEHKFNSHQRHKSYEKHQKHVKHDKHEKKHRNENSNKQSDDDSSRSLERADKRHHRLKHKKYDCNRKNCITPRIPKAVIPAPLPHSPGVVNINIPGVPKVNVNVPAVPKVNVSVPAVPKANVNIPTPPKVSIPVPPLPANPVNDLIDQTAHEAKQKAREARQ